MRFIATLVAVLLLPCSVRAQSLYGALTGNASDSSGAAVARAKVAVVNHKTNESRETQSNADGGYSFPNLTAGEYTLNITMHGFQSFQATNVVVSIDSVARVDATLQLGTMSEQVTVSAAAIALQTDRSDLRFETSERELRTFRFGLHFAF